jgi:hypothetical protein
MKSPQYSDDIATFMPTEPVPLTRLRSLAEALAALLRSGPTARGSFVYRLQDTILTRICMIEHHREAVGSLLSAVAEAGGTREELLTVVGLLRSHGMDVDEYGCDLTRYLIDASTLSVLEWWLLSSLRTSDWLWSPHALAASRSSDGGAPMREGSRLDLLEHAKYVAVIAPNVKRHAIIDLMQSAVDKFNTVELPALRCGIEAHLIPDLAAIVMRMLQPPAAEEMGEFMQHA